MVVVLPCRAAPLAKLAEVRALSHEEASHGVPVALEAVVLGLDPASPWNLFVHDGSAGCYVQLVRGSGSPGFKRGNRILIEGVTFPLGYYPSIAQAKATLLGRGVLPKPVRLEADRIFSPDLDSAWVQVPAVILGFESRDRRLTLDVEVYGLQFKAELPIESGAEERLSTLMNRPVVFQGVLATIFNTQRQMTDRHFFVSSISSFSSASEIGDGSVPPGIRVDQLLTAGFGPATPVRIHGLVTQLDSRGFYVRDESGSTFVNAPSRLRMPPGSWVEVDGFGSVAAFRPILRATHVSRMNEAPLAVPVPFPFGGPELARMQSELVRLQAVYLGTQRLRSDLLLQCRFEGQLFEAHLPGGLAMETLNSLVPGDTLEITGICELTTSHALPRIGWVDGFRLHLSGVGSIRVVEPAPWWTTTRLLVALGLMSTFSLVGLSVTWALRAQVKRQLAIIGESLKTEAVSKERDRMARELHDTLEQQLSGVALQLDGLDDVMRRNVDAAASSLSLARRMLRYTRLEARRSVWDLRSKMLEEHGLLGALREMAKTSGLGSSGVVLTVEGVGEAVRLSTPAEFHLFRIAQEAVANAVKHAKAHALSVTVVFGADAVSLQVKDDGVGFDPGRLDAGDGPHFGLLGMRERAARIGAQLTIVSSPGAGCTITVLLPSPQLPRR